MDIDIKNSVLAPKPEKGGFVRFTAVYAKENALPSILYVNLQGFTRSVNAPLILQH